MWYPGSLTNFSFNRLTACSFWFVISLFTAPNISAQEAVILEGGIGGALPEFEELWTLPVEGEVMDIEIPRNKNVDHFYCVTEDAETFRLYRITLKGELLWMREWKYGGQYQYIYGLKASDNGNVVVVHIADPEAEGGITKVFDYDGEQLWSKSASHDLYYPSPSGQFLTRQTSNNYFPLELFTPSGERVELKDTSFLKGDQSVHRFVANDRLLVYESFGGKAYLYLVSIPDGGLLWTREFDKPFWLIDINERNCDYNDAYIALQGTRRPADILLLDYNGKLIWRVEGLFSGHAISLSSDGSKVIAVEKEQWVSTLDVRTGERMDKTWIHRHSLLSRPKFDRHQHYVLISQADAIGKLREKLGFSPAGYMKYFAYILWLGDSEGKKHNLFASKGTLSTQYNPASGELLIVSSDNDLKTISGRVKHVQN